MTREEREILKREGNEENFKMLAAAIIREALTEYVAAVKNNKRTNEICRYVTSNDFKFFCDMIDVEHEEIINNKQLKKRIMVK
jgi:hypothetical protein